MLGITMGDANGVGPEILLRSFFSHHIPDEFCVFGDYEILKVSAEILNKDVSINRIDTISDYKRRYLNVFDSGFLHKENLKIGVISKEVGEAALDYVKRATQSALIQEIDAIVTLPINKEATRLSSPNFTGHTEIIAEICGVDNYTMMLSSQQLIVTHVSTHVSLEEAIRKVKKERILNVIKLTDQTIKKLRPNQRIAVAGLNPHAGENGAFGLQDIQEIVPAVKQAQSSNIDVTGPLPPDTVFFQAKRGDYDAVVCMYHDQGHIPMKLLDFEGGVNVTLGLPIVRTSVDHGTAYNIAYQGIASIKSFINACQLATKLSKNMG